MLHAAIVGNNEGMVRRLCCCKLGRMYEDDGFSVPPFTIDLVLQLLLATPTTWF